MSLRDWTLPFTLVLGGIISDYITTKLALSLFTGIFELHLGYNPFLALVIFFSSLTLLKLSLPEKKPWNKLVIAFTFFSYFGAINNLLVMAGIFSGFRTSFSIIV